MSKLGPAVVLAMVSTMVPPALSARAADAVDLQLILAVDVSRSMDPDELRVQRNGYVAAFRSPEILEAIRSGTYGRIAVTYMEWSSAYYQMTLVPWTIIANQTDLDDFTAALADAPISTDSRTSISNALLYAQEYFREATVVADRRTIDVSGDGANNDGVALIPVRDRLVADGITINGLPIMVRPTTIFGADGSIALEDYYKACVTGGPGSFVIPIASVGEFEPAIRRKLILEIASATSNVLPAASLAQPTPTVDCTVAEAQRNFNDPFVSP